MLFIGDNYFILLGVNCLYRYLLFLILDNYYLPFYFCFIIDNYLYSFFLLLG